MPDWRTATSQAFNADELQKALSDPEAAIRLLLENPVIRRMILESLRKIVEPLVVASNLTWLVFRSAFDMITDPAQIEECLKDPHAFFAYMLKKVWELSIVHWSYTHALCLHLFGFRAYL